jgi:hypothetical protein
MLLFIYLQKRTATLKHMLANIFTEKLGSKLLRIRWPKDVLRRKIRKRPETKNLQKSIYYQNTCIVLKYQFVDTVIVLLFLQ